MRISDWSSDVCSSDLHRVYYQGARLDLFGIGIPLPSFSHPIGDGADSGFLAPDIRYDRTNGIEIAVPYNFQFAPKDRQRVVQGKCVSVRVYLGGRRIIITTTHLCLALIL